MEKKFSLTVSALKNTLIYNNNKKNKFVVLREFHYKKNCE